MVLKMVQRFSEKSRIEIQNSKNWKIVPLRIVSFSHIIEGDGLLKSVRKSKVKEEGGNLNFSALPRRNARKNRCTKKPLNLKIFSKNRCTRYNG